MLVTLCLALLSRPNPAAIERPDFTLPAPAWSFAALNIEDEPSEGVDDFLTALDEARNATLDRRANPFAGDDQADPFDSSKEETTP